MMEYKGYHAEIKYSDEDRLFVGQVVGVSDTLAFHGVSVSELEEMFHQSIDNYLELCREFGKTPGGLASDRSPLCKAEGNVLE